MPEFSTFKMSCFAGEVNFFLRLFYNVHISIICMMACPRTLFPFDHLILCIDLFLGLYQPADMAILIDCENSNRNPSRWCMYPCTPDDLTGVVVLFGHPVYTIRMVTRHTLDHPSIIIIVADCQH